ncbi:MAG: histidine kinase dimerization/phosphoacceptor domain -containing protein, partial [bacterium]
ALMEILETEKSDLLDQPVWDTPWWRDKEEIKSKLSKTLPQLKPGDSLQFQTAFYTFSGDKRYVNFTFEPVTGKNDQVVYLVMEGRDITEDRRLLESYQESEQQYSRLTEDMLDSAPTGLCILDADFNVAWINDAMEEYYGIDRQKLVGEDVRKLINSRLTSIFENGERYREKLFETYEREKKVRKHIFHISGDENRAERWLEYSSQPIESGVFEGGRIEHYKDVTSLKETQSELKTTLREKETLLKEIHHRVKNNLQIISSLLSLQRRKTNSSRLKEAFEDSIHRIRSMAMIHEHLYQSETLDRVDFQVYINDICDHLLETHAVEESVDVFLEVEPIELNLDTAIACGLIINELVSNAIEHGSDPGGQNRIHLSFGTMERETIRLQVIDFGAGYDGEINFKSPDSMGLNIVKSLAEYELNGEIDFSSDEGFEVTVEFEL